MVRLNRALFIGRVTRAFTSAAAAAAAATATSIAMTSDPVSFPPTAAPFSGVLRVVPSGGEAASNSLLPPMPPLPQVPQQQQQQPQQQPQQMMTMLPADILSAFEPNPLTFDPPGNHGATAAGAGAGVGAGAAGGIASMVMPGQEQMMGALGGTLMPSTVSAVGGDTPTGYYVTMAAAAAAEVPSLEDHTEAFSNLKVDLAELDFGNDDEDFIDHDEGNLNNTSQSGGKPASIQGGGADNDALTEDLTHSCEGSQTSQLSLSSEHAQLLAMVRSALDLVVTFRAERREGGANGNQSTCDDAELHHALGRILYKHFSGNSSLEDGGVSFTTDRDKKKNVHVDVGSSDDALDDDIEASSRRKGRRTTVGCTAKSNDDRSGYAPLLDFGYPIRLSTLVDCLVKSRSSPNDNVCFFASTEDVEEELREMLEKPGRYLYDAAEAVYCDGQLRFAKDKLYGRSEEVATLMSAYDRVIHSKKEKRGIALINGYAGSGKSSLVDQILPRLQSDRASFVYCKFDIQGQEQPMSSFFRALDGYCQNLFDGDPTLLAEIRGAINYALGPSVSLLKGQVPSLGAVLGRESPVLQAAETTDALNHISYSLRLFVRAISGPTHPLVFLLDDLQYADKKSVDAINLLLKDTDTTSLLFIGCYREESVSIDHPLTEGLGDIAMTAEMPMSSITLSNLDKQSVNDMVSESLNMSRRLTRPLADAVHAKTRGNPMFVRELMASLYADGLIRYAATVRRWEWDIIAIREKDVADEVVDLLVGRMKGYGPEIELVLQVVACLGTSCDPNALCLCFTDEDRNSTSVDSCLMRLMADGLINKVGVMYRFGHDLIWQAAYALLTSSSKQQSMHLHVGRQLLKNGSEEERNQMMSIIADQLNRGVDLIDDDAERLLLTRMNLQVGRKELASMSFLPASLYLLQGTILVHDEDWKDHYQMCLQLFTSCAEVQLALGNSGETVTLATQVLTLGRSLQDKLGAYYALIKAKLLQGDVDESVKIGLSVLGQLGECFPTRVDEAKIGKELMETEHLLESSSLETISKTDAATDADRVATMRFLLLTSRIAYTINPGLNLLMNLRMVQTTMAGGLTPESSFAFSSCAFALCSIDHHDLAAFCAKVSISLLGRFNQKYAHITIPTLILSILAYRQPLQALVEEFRKAYKNAMAVGDVDWAIVSIGQVTNVSIFAPERGRNLGHVQDEFLHNLQELSMYNHMLFSLYVSPIKEALSNLRYVESSSHVSATSAGVENPPTVCFTADQNHMVSVCASKNLKNSLRKVYCNRMWLAYLYRRYDLAAEFATKNQKFAAGNPIYAPIETIMETLYLGLVAFAVLRERVRLGDSSFDGGEKWTKISTDVINKISRWNEEDSSWNFQNKIDLLNAEQAFTDGDYPRALEKYESSIGNAGKHGFINELALACERLGLFHQSIGNTIEAQMHLMLSKQHYRTWGATRKADDVHHLIQSM
eukprot:CAMPEP_0181023288 /NCGR_PEP_ID=MMETSP1070-20121207/1972_1 /TAXON_ID=265543 /ORGANISM="Minutocellus polymorphus, Strain NH13" /LENGTH=1457 /DNA_ID=CAMNT_0023100295 /DNA_START=2921 /DNA_END=7294 /DNA_ORIENTATION=+